MPSEQLHPINDVVAIVEPGTGAHVIELEDPTNPDVALPVACYQAERLTAEGVRSGEPAILFRFRPTPMQRGKIAIGEDLFLLMLLPNNRAALPIELQVGPGTYQLEAPQRPTGLLGADGQELTVERSVLWTPDQERR